MRKVRRASKEEGDTSRAPGRSTARRFFRYWFLPETIARALRVTALVAPILVVINHTEALLAWEWTPRLVLKVGLTFLVPYAVSSWSSARAPMQSSRS